MPIAIGTVLSLENEGEGWFPLAAATKLRGCVVAIIPSVEPFFVIRLEDQLEVQEAVADTPSGLRLHRYEYVVVNSRWTGIAVGSETAVSTHVRLVSPGSPPPWTTEACAAIPMRIWARCRVIA